MVTRSLTQESSCIANTFEKHCKSIVSLVRLANLFVNDMYQHYCKVHDIIDIIKYTVKHRVC